MRAAAGAEEAEAEAEANITLQIIQMRAMGSESNEFNSTKAARLADRPRGGMYEILGSGTPVKRN